ncbi:AMP-binding protein [Alicyclobacillus vulcanalis]|uniref:3-phosphoshikimate 1-carboxyvinyltransferase/cyclohexanecarboxylate-CoA ligase n=1 Tax=Alicyclobacillus vulcanalis TaxID=252246 RepID=A0A1N7JZ32_9BACL|nr:AMP-binding protein [Alicyclobacillus vulcanalis]SIS54599.1 3-phosphoshikimate 1-carboxyvinyltransferase/cyclohexanecarboxylate-CoA ligase [Alicyclobacillus vulcanalis]
MSAPLFLEQFESTLTRTPDELAVIDLSGEEPVTLTYGDLDRMATRIAARLLALGVEPGEAVAYQLPSGWPFVALTLAIWKAGATPCPILPQLREREVAFILNSSESRVYIAPDVFRRFDYRPFVKSVLQETPRVKHAIVLPLASGDPHSSDLGGLLAPEADAEAVRAELAARKPGPDSHSQLLYTSGTTGEPKGVLHTHRTLSEALFIHTRTLGLTSKDRIWVPSPTAHQTGFLYGMLVSFYIGAPGIYHATWDVEKARLAIEVYGATFVQAAMPFLSDITRADRPPKGLRLFIATGAAIPRQLAQEAREKLGCAVVGAWGSTESCLVTAGRPSDPPEKLWGTDGRVLDGMQIRVVDEAGRELPPGTEGNFQVKTPAMFVTYLHHPEWYDAAMTEDGFFDTGDLAVIDEDGYLRITGRKKDVVNRGGEKIPVVEIEDLLYQHPDIADAAVVAMPDERLGERACAYVVLKPGARHLDLSDITDFLGERGMAKIYWPERLEIIDEMPRTASGKIQKYVLRQDIARKLDRERAEQTG